MLQFIRVMVVDQPLDGDPVIVVGEGAIKLDDITAVLPVNNPKLCELVLKTDKIQVKGTPKYWIETLEGFVGQLWDATGIEEDAKTD